MSELYELLIQQEDLFIRVGMELQNEKRELGMEPFEAGEASLLEDNNGL